jgi:hypothetical protein
VLCVLVVDPGLIPHTSTAQCSRTNSQYGPHTDLGPAAPPIFWTRLCSAFWGALGPAGTPPCPKWTPPLGWQLDLILFAHGRAFHAEFHRLHLNRLRPTIEHSPSGILPTGRQIRSSDGVTVKQSETCRQPPPLSRSHLTSWGSAMNAMAEHWPLTFLALALCRRWRRMSAGVRWAYVQSANAHFTPNCRLLPGYWGPRHHPARQRRESGLGHHL